MIYLYFIFCLKCEGISVSNRSAVYHVSFVSYTFVKLVVFKIKDALTPNGEEPLLKQQYVNIELLLDCEHTTNKQYRIFLRMYEHDKQTQPLSEKNHIIQPANRPFDC